MDFIINLAIENIEVVAVGLAAVVGFGVRHIADWIDAKAKAPQTDIYDLLKELKDELSKKDA